MTTVPPVSAIRAQPDRRPDESDRRHEIVEADPADEVRPSRVGGGGVFESGRWGMFDPGRPGVKALAAVAAVVALGAAFVAWRARPRPEPVVPDVVASGSFAPDQEAGATPAEVVVAVAGKVRRPGLVRLPTGSRVADALEAAGGALPGVDVALLNLARRVVDGELILVGVSAPPGAPGGVASGSTPGPGPGDAKVSLNTATLAQLETLPGVGPVLAQRILDRREQIGGFRSIGDLRQVDGIGDARYEQLKDLVTL